MAASSHPHVQVATFSAPFTPEIGDLVGNYAIIDKLGSGSFGTVFKAEHTTSKAKFALKFIPFKNGNELDKTLVREISILYDIEHPNTVRLENALVHAGYLALIMELASTSLAKEVTSGKITPANCKAVLKQIIEAVEYLHERNVIHRDLKPDNVLIDEDCNAKVADFGLARGWHPDSLMTPQVATPDYNAPEILLGSTSYSKAVDIWSIGCVGCLFAELVCGHPPFEGQYVQVQLLYASSSGRAGLPAAKIRTIFSELGTPTDASWPGVTSLPHFPTDVPIWPMKKFELGADSFLNDDGKDLLRKMLCMNPEERITPKEALEHPYFAE